MQPFGTGSSYSFDSNLLALPVTTAWWSSGGNGTINANEPAFYGVSVNAILTFTNGDVCHLNSSGIFSMYRPVASFSPTTGTVQVTTNTDGSADLSCGSLGWPGITYHGSISYPSNFPGSSYLLQVFTRTSRIVTDRNQLTHTNVQVPANGPWLDRGADANHPQVYGYTEYNNNPSDSPDLILAASDLRGDVGESLQITMMFTPPGGGIDVPLITLPWSWNGSAWYDTNNLQNWTLTTPDPKIHTNAVIVSPGFPVWTDYWTNNNFQPPF
jgi:hypothetical protein